MARMDRSLIRRLCKAGAAYRQGSALQEALICLSPTGAAVRDGA